MSPSTLSISITNGHIGAEDYVLIEQQEWPKDVGRTSVAQGLLGISAAVFGTGMPDPNCGGLSRFSTSIYLYPSRVGLLYTFDITHGVKILSTTNLVVREEVLQCNLKDSVDTNYPVQLVRSIEWIGECYNSTGDVVAKPLIRQDGCIIYISDNVYGSIRIKYSVLRVEVVVSISARLNSIENNFESVAYCVWNGGVNYIDVNAPSGYDLTAGNCGNGIYTSQGADGAGGSSEICTPSWGQGTIPVAVKADRRSRVHYCSQELMSDTVTESEESENQPGSKCSNGPIVTN